MYERFTRMMPWPELVWFYRLTKEWERQRNDPPAYNVAPTDRVPFVTAGENGGSRSGRRNHRPLPRRPIALACNQLAA